MFTTAGCDALDHVRELPRSLRACVAAGTAVAVSGCTRGVGLLGVQLRARDRRAPVALRVAAIAAPRRGGAGSDCPARRIGSERIGHFGSSLLQNSMALVGIRAHYPPIATTLRTRKEAGRRRSVRLARSATTAGAAGRPGSGQALTPEGSG